MKVFRLITKWFTIEFGSTSKILFTVSMLFLTGGIGMVTENLWIHIFDTAIDIILKKEESHLNEIIGFVLITIGLIFLFVSLKNWKIDIYLNIYRLVQNTMNELYTTLYMRERGFDRNTFQNQHDLIYKLYIEGTKYVDANKILIDKEISSESRGVLYQCAQELDSFQSTIDNTEKLINGDRNMISTYDPNQDLKESKIEIDEIYSRYKELENLLRAKMILKIM